MTLVLEIAAGVFLGIIVLWIACVVLATALELT
jgi:hypothetical protein